MCVCVCVLEVLNYSGSRVKRTINQSDRQAPWDRNEHTIHVSNTAPNDKITKGQNKRPKNRSRAKFTVFRVIFLLYMLASEKYIYIHISNI